MKLTIGSSLGPYEIRASLGAGGMGEVYRAHDPRLGRDVALKVLSAAVSREPAGLERFAREARSIAALNHPHIVTIYSTEEADCVPFLTMELVEGQTLDALIPPGGLTLGRFLELAVPLADALTAAHQKGITHRDLKPANVMIAADGRIKVLDFGLALVVSTPAADRTVEATQTLLTGAGTIVGTMPYMSPEQIEGRPIDGRSDLFSLGIMFYEMLAGVRPFAGDSSPGLMLSILKDTPANVSERRADVPEAVARLVERLLEKRPDDRVQTARDVYNELRRVQKGIESGTARRVEGGSSAARAREAFWIAVLPFTCRTADEDLVLLADGLTDDITAGLSRFQYEEALVHAKAINMPLFPWSQLASAAAAGQLGRAAEAQTSLAALARTHPHFLDPAQVRTEWGRWIWDDELLERLIEGLQKARALVTSAVQPGSGPTEPSSPL